MCQHKTPCPTAVASDRKAARTVARDDVLGWALLCNGVVLFDVMPISMDSGACELAVCETDMSMSGGGFVSSRSDGNAGHDRLGNLGGREVSGVHDFGFSPQPGKGVLVARNVVQAPLPRTGFDRVTLDALGQRVCIGVQDEVPHRNASLRQPSVYLSPVQLDQHRLRDDKDPADEVEDLRNGLHDQTTPWRPFLEVLDGNGVEDVSQHEADGLGVEDPCVWKERGNFLRGRRLAGAEGPVQPNNHAGDPIREGGATVGPGQPRSEECAS